MKRVILGAGVLFLALNCHKLTVQADEGFTKYVQDIECTPFTCVEYSIPKYSGFKSYMSYSLFGKNTDQYTLQQMAVTDEEGFRRIDDYYVVAVGSYFGTSVGQRIDLKLLNGETIKCVVGDEKANKDTDKTNMFSKNNCLSEFLVDTKVLNTTVKNRGDVSYFPEEQWDSPVTEVIVYEEYLLEENL